MRFVQAGVFVLRAQDQYRRSALVELPGLRPITAMAWVGFALLVGTQGVGIWQIDPSGNHVQISDVDGFVVALAADDEAVYAVVARSGRQRLVRFPLTAPQQLVDLVEPGTLGDVTDVLVADGMLFLTDFHKGRVFALRDETLREVITGLSTPAALTQASDGTIYVAEFQRGAVARILP